MKRLLLFVVLGILVIGLAVAAQKGVQGQGNGDSQCVETEQNGTCCLGENCSSVLLNCLNGTHQVFKGCDKNCTAMAECEEDEIDDEDDTDNGGTVVTHNKTRIREKGNMTFIPWQKRNESECLAGCKCVGAVMSCPTETGKTMTIQAGRSGNIIVITIEKTNVSTELELELENETGEEGENETKLKAKLSDGKTREIKVMPEVASERALERLRLKVCSEENNCTIELKEVSNKATYELQAERHFRILAMFRVKAQVKAQVDAETGDITVVKKPWWAFLASESEE